MVKINYVLLYMIITFLPELILKLDNEPAF